jgi:hypothetical protein
VLGLLLALGICVFGRRCLQGSLGLLWAYTIVAVGLSFLTSLKEPRHLFGVLPAAALIAGSALAEIWNRRHAGLGGRSAPAPRAAVPIRSITAGAIVVLILTLAGPFCLPLLGRSSSRGMAWIAPAYAERLANERFYHVLALAGKRAAAMTAPGEVVTVVHQAPVVAYYADRPYRMLYTLPIARVTEQLSQANVLVWDAPTFPALNRDEIERVQAAVSADFLLEEVVSDNYRSVAIYKRKVKP